MGVVYAYLIMKDLRTYASIPAKAKEATAQALRDLDMEELITE